MGLCTVYCTLSKCCVFSLLDYLKSKLQSNNRLPSPGPNNRLPSPGPIELQTRQKEKL